MAMRREMPEQDRIEICKQAAGLIQRDDERNMLLAALGSLKKTALLNLIIPCLDNQGTRAEAINTVLAIVEKRNKGRDVAVTRQALQKVVAVGGDSGSAKKAGELLKSMEGEK
jgi:molybdopterin-guanine dinucleotide biosynthesis protein